MPTRANTIVRTCRLGRAEYREVAQLQRALRAAREARAVDDVLLMVEHDPVITCGTRTELHEVAFSRAQGVPHVAVERGGKATYHAPGQVVAYPIFGIELVDGDVKQLVHRLEQAIIDTLDAHDVVGARHDGFPGVWVGFDGPRPRKLASVGLRLTRGVTFHGVAINVSCDLDPFGWFTPCGIPDVEMTSIARELDREGDDPRVLASLVRSVEDQLAAQVAAHFELVQVAETIDALQAVATAYPAPDPDVSLPGEPRPSRLAMGAPA